MSDNAKKRTLGNLLRLDDRVWVRIGTEKLWKRFVKAAEEEGFRLGKGSPLEAERDSVMVVHADKTITYPGINGHLGFARSEGPMTRVDYGAYTEGRDDFLLTLVTERRLVNTKRPAFVRSETVW